MDFELVLLFAIALIPGLFWLFLLALRFRSDRESRRQILKIFVLGMAICTPAGFFNTWLQGVVGGGAEDSSWISNLLLFVLVVGPNEEGLKFLIVWSEGYRKWRFRNEMDGVILATAAALGFATYENAEYMQRFGIQVLMLRAWACVLGHICFSAIFGYYLGLAKAKKYNTVPCIAEGLVLAALFHGGYDFLVGVHELAIYGIVPCLVAYYFCLTKGWIRPYLSLVAPNWMAYRETQTIALGFQRRRFPVLPGKAAVGKIDAALARMESLDMDERRSAVEAGRTLHDQRIFEKLQQLTHDPDEPVRLAATAVYKEMRRALRERT